MTVRYLRKQFRENLILRAAMIFAMPWIVFIIVTILVIYADQIDAFFFNIGKMIFKWKILNTTTYGKTKLSTDYGLYSS